MRHLLAPALLAVVLTACGGGSDESDSTADETSPSTSSSSTATAPETPETSSAPADDPKAAITARFNAYATAFFAGDGAAAYAIVSERCQEKTPLSEFASYTEAAADTYGALEPTIDSIEVDGDRALVQSTFGVPALDDQPDDTEPNWVFENGDWFSDKCDD